MRFQRDIAEAGARFPHAVAAIGNFDGLHLGHESALALARTRALEAGAPFLLLTFEPHPRLVFSPASPPFRLTPPVPRLRRLAALGLDCVLGFRFSHPFAARTAEDFVREDLLGALKLQAVVVGESFRFGAKRAGDIETLKRLGVETLVVPPFCDSGGRVVSSSAIRAHLRDGDAQGAAALLGRPFVLEGRVARGAGRGRGLGMATANLNLAEIGGGLYLRPRYGVYAVRAALDGGDTWLDGVANLGITPMFPRHEPVLETHLFGEHPTLWGRRMRVALVAHLRDEADFGSEAALRARMQDDRARAERVLAEVPNTARPKPARPNPAGKA